MKKSVLSIFMAGIIVCSAYSLGLALNNQEVFSQFQFNFITPGSRATALGGAFIGLADDATAVESNPAGLTVLTAPEISMEFKHITYTAEQIYANPNLIDNIDPETGTFVTNITKKEFDDVVKSVPFISVVYPYKRFVFSVYRQEVINYKSTYQTSSTPIAQTGTSRSFLPVDASVDMAVTNYGFGAAIQVFEGLSLAVSPRWSEMKMNSHSTRFGFHSFPYPTDFSDEDIRTHSEIDDEDFGFSVNAGILWKPHPRVSMGAVYRKGTKFVVTETYFDRTTGDIRTGDLTEFTVNIPDSFGVGTAWKATNFLTVTLDVIHIRYKDLLEDFDILYYHDTYTPDNFTVENATEVHAGVEYILALGERFLALRAGIYNDPEHIIRFTGTTGDPLRDISGKALFPGGDDQIHVTGGLGLVINEHLQIDTAANIADKLMQLSLSAVYRF